MEEQHIVKMLENWEEFLEKEQEKITLKEYINHMKSFSSQQDWKESIALLRKFEEFAKRHAGEKDCIEDARVLRKTAQHLEKVQTEVIYKRLAMSLYLEEARMWEMAGEKSKAPKAYKSASWLLLELEHSVRKG